MLGRVLHRTGHWLWGMWPRYGSGRLLDVTELARAREAARRAEQRSAVVAALGQRALAGTTPSDLMDEAIDATVHALRTAFGAVVEAPADRDELVVRAASGAPAGMAAVGRVLPKPSDGLPARALATAEPVVVGDWDAERQLRLPPVAREVGIRSSAGVVIRGRGAPFGVLSVAAPEPRRFGSEEVHFPNRMLLMDRLEHALGSAAQRRAGVRAARGYRRTSTTIAAKSSAR